MWGLYHLHLPLEDHLQWGTEKNKQVFIGLIMSVIFSSIAKATWLHYSLVIVKILRHGTEDAQKQPIIVAHVNITNYIWSAKSPISANLTGKPRVYSSKVQEIWAPT